MSMTTTKMWAIADLEARSDALLRVMPLHEKASLRAGSSIILNMQVGGEAIWRRGR